MTEGFPVEQNSIRLIAGLWYVILPNDKHPDSRLLQNGLIVYNVPSTDYEAAEKNVKVVNEWARARGGRPVQPKIKAQEYLKF